MVKATDSALPDPVYEAIDGWLDLLVGEPVSDDFFCLQASLKALPLTSEIPYDIAPELQANLNVLETKFVGAPAPSPAITIASTAKVVPVPAPPLACSAIVRENRSVEMMTWAACR